MGLLYQTYFKLKLWRFNNFFKFEGPFLANIVKKSGCQTHLDLACVYMVIVALGELSHSVGKIACLIPPVLRQWFRGPNLSSHLVVGSVAPSCQFSLAVVTFRSYSVFSSMFTSAFPLASFSKIISLGEFQSRMITRWRSWKLPWQVVELSQFWTFDLLDLILRRGIWCFLDFSSSTKFLWKSSLWGSCSRMLSGSYLLANIVKQVPQRAWLVLVLAQFLCRHF